ncbi:MAG: hypothetical protein AAGI13_04245 [Pseudomonadota bacterium]
MQNVGRTTSADPGLHGEVDDLHMPLRNMAFTIQHYLLENGMRLDWRTRYFLAGLRDSLNTVVAKADDLPCAAQFPRSDRIETEDLSGFDDSSN